MGCEAYVHRFETEYSTLNLGFDQTYQRALTQILAKLTLNDLLMLTL